MGTLTECYCEACNYAKGVRIGGGMGTFREFSSWPAYCNDCHDLVNVNIQARPLVCLDCGSDSVTKYGSPILSDTTGPARERWGHDTLSEGLHFCPKCRHHTLRFGSREGRFPILFD